MSKQKDSCPSKLQRCKFQELDAVKLHNPLGPGYILAINEYYRNAKGLIIGTKPLRHQTFGTTYMHRVLWPNGVESTHLAGCLEKSTLC